MDAAVIYCKRCGRELNPVDSVALELNAVTRRYRDETMQPFPESESQGWFDFGKACAARTLKEGMRDE